LDGSTVNAYKRHVLPSLIHLAMRIKTAAAERARIVPLASGTVVEIGAGSGLNLPYYGVEVERLYTLDPSPSLLRMARRAATRGTLSVAALPSGHAGVLVLADLVERIAEMAQDVELVE
jgi:hypothetical protein